MDAAPPSAGFSLDSYLLELIDVLHGLDRDTVDRIANRLCVAQVTGRTVFCCGNGGSAAIAAHWATDLAKLTAQPGVPRLRVLSLTDSPATITAAANDFDYSEVFVEQLRTFLAPGDLVIGISTSGRSPNVLRALDFANAHGGVSIVVTGSGGEALREVACETLVIASRNVQRIEDAASITAHLTCLLVRQKIAEAAAGARTEERAAGAIAAGAVDGFAASPVESVRVLATRGRSGARSGSRKTGTSLAS
jgi:D-sedoheptulose 7-phosphate isomerase